MSHWFIHSTNSLKKVLRLKSLTHSLGRSIQAHYSEKTWRKISKRIRTIGDSLYEWIIESFIQAIRSNLHTTTVCCSETHGGRSFGEIGTIYVDGTKANKVSCDVVPTMVVIQYLILVYWKTVWKCNICTALNISSNSTFIRVILLVCVIQLDVCTNLWLKTWVCSGRAFLSAMWFPVGTLGLPGVLFASAVAWWHIPNSVDSGVESNPSFKSFCANEYLMILQWLTSRYEVFRHSSDCVKFLESHSCGSHQIIDGNCI